MGFFFGTEEVYPLCLRARNRNGQKSSPPNINLSQAGLLNLRKSRQIEFLKCKLQGRVTILK